MKSAFFVKNSQNIRNTWVLPLVTNSGKQAKWKDIADAVNALGHELRTTAEVKAKWKNLTSKTKETFHKYKKYQKLTGGGAAPKPPSDSVMKTIELMQDDSSFKGVDGGISTFNPPGRKNPLVLLGQMASNDSESDDDQLLQCPSPLQPSQDSSADSDPTKVLAK